MHTASGQVYIMTRALSCAVRAATVKRETKETKVEVSINLDGTGVCSSSSQIPFLDHMMDVSPFSTLLVKVFSGRGSSKTACYVFFSCLRGQHLHTAYNVWLPDACNGCVR